MHRHPLVRATALAALIVAAGASAARAALPLGAQGQKPTTVPAGPAGLTPTTAPDAPPSGDLPAVESVTGLRILPPTGTQLLAGQRFDLRVETQNPASAAPALKSVTINGTDYTDAFKNKAQGPGEDAAPSNALLYGRTVRNLSFTTAGMYKIVATVTVDGVDRSAAVTLPVIGLPDNVAINGQKPKHVVFFLGDAMGLPVRSAARIMGKGVVEGRTQGQLRMDDMDAYGLVHTASFDSVITDSAPGMATYVSGMKQPNNGLNVSVDNTPESNLDNPRIETLFEFLKRTRGWRTGVVTDAFVTDATPAAVAVHTRARSNRTAIAQQMLGYYQDGTAQPLTGYTALSALTQPLDVIIGSGAVDWLKSSNPDVKNFYQYSSGGRPDVDLLANVAPSLGYSVARNLTELQAAADNQPLLGIWTGEFRTTSSGLGTDNVPGVLDRLVARGKATIRGKDASASELGMNVAPPKGIGCGATVAECFRQVPSKKEAVQKAVTVLNNLAGDGGWILEVEQSQTDKLAHPLEYERTIYEALELDETLGWVLDNVPDALVVVTADHAQPESIVGVAFPNAITPGGATPPGGCFSGTQYPLTLGSSADADRPCALQDVVGTFNDGSFPTYADANGDGYPDDPDPSVKLVIDDGGRPTYSTNFLTNFQPLAPSGKNAAIPNPNRAPDGLLMTGNMPTRNVSGGANRTNGNTTVAPHSAEDVPLSASGTNAELFIGSYENADVHVRLAAAISGLGNRSALRGGSGFSGVPLQFPSGAVVLGF